MSSKERLIEDDLKKTTDYEALRELYYKKTHRFIELRQAVAQGEEGGSELHAEGGEELSRAAVRSAANERVQKAAAVHNDPGA